MKKDQKPYIIGAIAAAAVYYFFFRKPDADDIEASELAQEAAQAGAASYADSQFFAWANVLEEAMFDWGTNEEAIYNIFNALNNNADFIKLKQAFGMREYTGGTLPYWFYGEYSLEQWLSSEGETAAVNEILQGKNITYRV
jgi:hypothetical protein